MKAISLMNENGDILSAREMDEHAPDGSRIIEIRVDCWVTPVEALAFARAIAESFGGDRSLADTRSALDRMKRRFADQPEGL